MFVPLFVLTRKNCVCDGCDQTYMFVGMSGKHN